MEMIWHGDDGTESLNENKTGRKGNKPKNLDLIIIFNLLVCFTKTL